METEEPESGRTEKRPQSNVVPLPRDWLGPREELVPFGPAAARAAQARRNAAPSHEDADLDQPARRGPGPSLDDADLAPPALSAQSFWTEDSASVHHPLEPPPSPRPPAGDSRPPRPRRLPAGKALTGLKRRYGRPALAALTTLAVAAFFTERVAPRSASSPAGPLAPTALIGHTPAVGLSPFAIRGGSARSAGTEVQDRRRAVVARRPHSPAAKRHVRRRTARAPAPQDHVVTVAAASPATAAYTRTAGSVSQTSTASSASSYSRTQAAPPSVPVSQSVPAGHSGGTTAPTTAQASQSHPAYGATGVLGPGSSPDS